MSRNSVSRPCDAGGFLVRQGRQRIWRLVIEVVKRFDQHKGSKGLVVLPRCWVVERTFAWLTMHRRLVRDYETLPETHEAMVRAAGVWTLSRRLAR